MSAGIDGISGLFFRIDLEIEDGLNCCLAVRKNVDVPTFVANFCILHYMLHNGTHFGLEYCGMEPKAEAMLPPQATSVQSSTSAFNGLGLLCVPDQSPCIIWCESIVLFTLVRELDHQWLVVHISWCYPVSTLSITFVSSVTDLHNRICM
jgi:hypothetical protein